MTGLAALLLMACTAEEGGPGDAVVSMALNISSGAVTRLADEVTQTGSTARRTVGSLYVIPYATQGKIGADDTPLLNQAGGIRQIAETPGLYYYTSSYEVPQRTASFLCYCRAVPLGDGSKKTNGSLVVPDLGQRMLTSNIQFSPDAIWPNETPDDAAFSIATYLTTIAQTYVTIGGAYYSWATSENANLKMFFEYFTNQGELLPGSSSSVAALVENLRTSVSRLSVTSGTVEHRLQQAILEAIDGGRLPAGYPASVGLPDGAAVLRWSAANNAFSPQTQASTLASMVSQNRYAYPAELWFFANSQIGTSQHEMTSDDYEGKTWEQVLAGFEQKPGVVSRTTLSAAVIDPLRHGVGCLKATVRASVGSLPDANLQDIELTPTTFPLTGLLVSGQYCQDFNFEPMADDLTEYVIYDRELGDISLTHTDAPTTFSTLTFQSKESDDPVWLALEFENNSGQAFQGYNGVVYPGTKFYLIGSLCRPAEPATDKDYEHRVFTKNCITQASLVVSSLEKAYNVVPDLLSARLEVGIQLTTDWIEATTTNVILK